MFSSVLPEEMERMIWKFYFENVMKEVTEQDNVWKNPSIELRNYCRRDKGCIQIGHTDLESFCPDTEPGQLVKEGCLNKVCASCHRRGFPCLNAVYHGRINKKLAFLWSLRHYEYRPDVIID